MEQWEGFNGTKWKQIVDVNDFIINNYKEYTGSSDFLHDVSKKTSRILSRCQKLEEKEDITRVLDIESNIFAGIDNFEPGYIDKKVETVVGLQTDEPLKQFVNPYIALDSSIDAMKEHGYRLDRELIEAFNDFQFTTENSIKDTYTKEVTKYKECNLIGCLPDEFGRGYIVSDYRRLALYGIDFLIEKKEHDLDRLRKNINYSMVRTREEVVRQIETLRDIKSMASRYGIDISMPAKNTHEAIQWLYFGYLAASKETNGISMPIGNNSAFLDIYINRDIELGILNEERAQELIDQFIIKLRLIRFLRKGNFYDYVEGRKPIITETIGGMNGNSSMVTKTAYRMLHSLNNLEVNPIPNFSILWNEKLPDNFKHYCIDLLLKYNNIQFINSKRMDAFDISSTGLAGLSKVGKQIDYFGGFVNLPKVLLYAINGGRDEITGELVIEGIEPLTGDTLEYPKVVKNFSDVLSKVITVTSDALNICHYMHDKYSYESSLMAFNDTVVERYMTFSMVGLSTIVDSLSAIRYSTVTVNRDENDLSIDFTVSGSYPRYGNNEEKADKLAGDIIKLFNKEVREHQLYRNAKPKVGIESLGMDVLFGLKTGATPDGRFKSTILSVAANPTSNVDRNGLLASLKSTMKLPSNLCLNGIVTTMNILPNAVGTSKEERVENLIGLLDGYFNQNGNHLEINILERNTLLDASKISDSSLVLRNGGYSIRYSELTKNQQDALVDRTFHGIV